MDFGALFDSSGAAALIGVAGALFGGAITNRRTAETRRVAKTEEMRLKRTKELRVMRHAEELYLGRLAEFSGKTEGAMKREVYKQLRENGHSTEIPGPVDLDNEIERLST